MKLGILQPAAAVAVVGSETHSNCKAKQKLLPTQTAYANICLNAVPFLKGMVLWSINANLDFDGVAGINIVDWGHSFFITSR